MKLNLGSGNNLIDGFVNIDKYDREADMLLDMADLHTMFKPESIDEIVIYQALEHTPWFQLPHILKSCYTVMKEGATLTIEVPDMDVIAEGILRDGVTQKWQDNIHGGYHRPWDQERYPDALFHAGSIHYQAFNFQKLHDALVDVGFKSENIHKNSMEEKHKDYKYEENLSVRVTK